jgi:hypothetical protein
MNDVTSLMRLCNTIVLLSKRNFCQSQENLKLVIKKNNNDNDFKELKKNNIRINKKKTKIESSKKRLKTKFTTTRTTIQIDIYKKIIKYLARRLIVNIFKLLQSSFNLTNKKIY